MGRTSSDKLYHGAGPLSTEFGEGNRLDSTSGACYDDEDNLINPLRGDWGDEPQKLNKTTGCESRTVPPLYVPMLSSLAKASHWGIPLGRLMKVWSPNHKGTSQKTYALVSPTPASHGGVLVAETRLRRLLRTPQPI